MRLVVKAPQYIPPPASGDLKSHPELSGWRSPRKSVMRVIVLHLYAKFEVRRPSRSEDMADFRSRPWPLSLWALNGVTGHPCHGRPSCQFSSYSLTFSTEGQVRDRQTDGQITAISALCPHSMGLGIEMLVSLQFYLFYPKNYGQGRYSIECHWLRVKILIILK